MGYVTDIAYMPSFIAELAPEWLDLVAIVGGFAPPARGDGYRWCELGCGRGLTPLILAAARPAGQFVGVDLMPEHIAGAERLAAGAGIANVAFRAQDFAAAADEDLPPFDYIVAHGVYSWIDARARAALHRFVARHLAPGGLVYLSYNSMPGWIGDAPFQFLVHAFAAAEPGTSDARFAAAAGRVRAVADAGAATLARSDVLRRLRDGDGGLPPSYYAHEYLASDWRPRYVTEVRTAMAEIGLVPVGSATLADNFDRLVVRAAARDTLAAIAEPDLRELARDYCMNQRFRRDVFGPRAIAARRHGAAAAAAGDAGRARAPPRASSTMRCAPRRARCASTIRSRAGSSPRWWPRRAPPTSAATRRPAIRI